MSALRSSADTLELLARNLEAQGGAMSVAKTSRGWAAAIEFGREAPDSDMVGGAAYGLGNSMAEALNAALDKTGWRL